MRKDFLYIATHGREDALLLKLGGSPLLEAKELDSATVFPRIVLADCCDTGKVPPGKGWGESLAGSFTGASRCAVFVGNIDKAIYDSQKGSTVFSKAFIEEFSPNIFDKPFAELIRKVRLEQSEKNDAQNTQVVYVAGGWDVMALRSRVLTDSELPPPPELPPGTEPQPEPESKAPWPAFALLAAALLSLAPVLYIWRPSYYFPWPSFAASAAGIMCGAGLSLPYLLEKKRARRKKYVDR
jgi:hypothetical protein